MYDVGVIPMAVWKAIYMVVCHVFSFSFAAKDLLLDLMSH